MKIFLLLLLVTVLSCTGNQSVKKVNQPDTLQTSKKKDMVNIVKLNDIQTNDWEKIRMEVMHNCIGPCFKKYKVIDDCENCNRLLMGYSISIDSLGKAVKIEKIREEIECSLNKAQIKELNEQIITYLKSKEFPPSLRNISFEAGVGFILRC
ncbi:hypothetical protein IM793_23425 [Pedobacter sp. MR2016-19]|uniref:hypothetical protein n=1 Tax=Pedobacter sp. MR2016-19 TaxID=2780089 RepID=UPI0018767AC0|nr:hypothetical protein [Pedobacter sp. MR2016-19]MBE5322125.1 hypothetical protein [Pedobacter sp. MR2016-19]